MSLLDSIADASGNEGKRGNRRGRPSLYTAEITEEICERLANGCSLSAICALEDMPNAATVFRWLQRHAEFCERYARAREAQADFYAAEIIDIADTAIEGVKTRTSAKDGTVIETGDMVERSRLRVDARKWAASKIAPKKYGDKLELAGSVDLGPTVAEILRGRQAKLAAAASAETGDSVT